MRNLKEFLLLLLLSLTAHATGIDRDVEDGKAQERRAYYGMSRSEYQKIKDERSQQNNDWRHNRSCRRELHLNECNDPQEKPQKCFSADIQYKYTKTFDEFPLKADFLRHFPSCWAAIAPLICVAQFRPCASLINSDQIKITHMFVEQVATHFCDEVRQKCAFLFDNYSSGLPSFLECENYRSNGILNNNKNTTNTSTDMSIYNSNCNINFYTAHPELHQLSKNFSGCPSGLVYVDVRAEQTRSSPFIDDSCFLSCRAAIYNEQHFAIPINTLYYILTIVALVALFYGGVHSKFAIPFFQSYNVDLAFDLIAHFISFILIVSAHLDEIICSNDRRIRRHSQTFNGASFDFCTVQAYLLKYLFFFTFWRCFTFACCNFCEKQRSIVRSIVQLICIVHPTLCPLLSLQNRELTVDPTSKMCHLFVPHSLLISASEFGSILLFALIIFWLSRNCRTKDSELMKHAESHLLHESEEHNSEDILPNPANIFLRFWQNFTRNIHVIWLVIHAFFLLSICLFYWLSTPELELDLIKNSINCSIGKEFGAKNDRSCHIEIPEICWNLLNSLLISNIPLMAAIVLSALPRSEPPKRISKETIADCDQNAIDLDEMKGDKQQTALDQGSNSYAAVYNNDSSTVSTASEWHNYIVGQLPGFYDQRQQQLQQNGIKSEQQTFGEFRARSLSSLPLFFQYIDPGFNNTGTVPMQNADNEMMMMQSMLKRDGSVPVGLQEGHNQNGSRVKDSSNEQYNKRRRKLDILSAKDQRARRRHARKRRMEQNAQHGMTGSMASSWCTPSRCGQNNAVRSSEQPVAPPNPTYCPHCPQQIVLVGVPCHHLFPHPSFCSPLASNTTTNCPQHQQQQVFHPDTEEDANSGSSTAPSSSSLSDASCSDDETDSNAFRSDSPDSTEERLWEEKCREADQKTNNNNLQEDA